MIVSCDFIKTALEGKFSSAASFLSDGGTLPPLQAAGNELAPGGGGNLLTDRRPVRPGGDSTGKAQAVGAQVLQFLPV